mmetsp:Transcript_36589/g.108746  ORF Transcript_36589/g.108746 Transcript_36589/m.108746 type:complete len:218 (+) Transcript_36589:123-776(+)
MPWPVITMPASSRISSMRYSSPSSVTGCVLRVGAFSAMPVTHRQPMSGISTPPSSSSPSSPRSPISSSTRRSTNSWAACGRPATSASREALPSCAKTVTAREAASCCTRAPVTASTWTPIETKQATSSGLQEVPEPAASWPALRPAKSLWRWATTFSTLLKTRIRCGPRALLPSRSLLSLSNVAPRPKQLQPAEKTRQFRALSSSAMFSSPSFASTC